MQWDFWNKEKLGWTGKSSFDLEVTLGYLRPSIIYSVPCAFRFILVLKNLESPGILLWHFLGLESPGTRPLVLESFGNLLNLTKNMKCTEGSKKKQHWDLGSIGFNVNFRALEKSISVLEKSWKFVSEKWYKPCMWPDHIKGLLTGSKDNFTCLVWPSRGKFFS